MAEVNALEERMRAYSDGELRALTDAYRAREEPLHLLLPEAFATVREVVRRVLGVRLHDEQIMGGAALTVPAVAEMRGGEGKTLACVLAAYLRTLTGESVHVMTVTDRLARRDADWMGPVYQGLGLDTGLIQPGMGPDERRAAYGADVTYGTALEFGYDFLRDNMAWSTDECVQRGHGSAIVDGADYHLLETVVTPMIISGPGDEPSRWLAECATIAASLRPGDDYEVDTASRTVSILEAGVEKIEDRLGLDNLYDPGTGELPDLLRQALRAKELYHKGREYVVEDEQVIIVDEITGELLYDRRYSGDLHPALEAKEGVPIRPGRVCLAQITIDGLLREYGVLSGVTATAPAAHREAYLRIYRLPAVTIPTHRPTMRVDHPDMGFETEDEQLAAVVAEVADRQAAGQPVLVDTVPVDRAVRLSRLLDGHRIEHRLLKRGDDIATLSDAGRPGAVTVAAQCVGRGVTIVLRGATAAERDQVVRLGGLYVVATERYGWHWVEQVRGQAGRGGDPGESKLIHCELDDYPKGIGFRWTERALQIEAVLNEQRQLVYAERQRILFGEDLRGRIRRAVDEVIDQYADGYADAHVLWRACKQLYPISIPVAEIIAAPGRVAVATRIKADAQLAYDRRERDLGLDVMRELEFRVVISVTDKLWREHMAAMDALWDETRFHPTGKGDPLPEYRREGAQLFAAKMAEYWEQIVGYLYNLEVEVEDTA